MKITVLRLGHRYIRDDRTTTHLFLVARAFGANRVIYSGQKDPKIKDQMEKVTKTWGGRFEVKHEKNWESVVSRWKINGGEVIHLTMYGLPLLDVITEIRRSAKEKMIVVGGAKVPHSIYDLADWNVAVTSQPHSEISAVSIFLHELFEGKELSKPFMGARLVIQPQARGKKVIKYD